MGFTHKRLYFERLFTSGVHVLRKGIAYLERLFTSGYCILGKVVHIRVLHTWKDYSHQVFAYLGRLLTQRFCMCYRVNNCVGFTNYKFFVLFLGYGLIYCFYVAVSSVKYFIEFWTVSILSSVILWHSVFNSKCSPIFQMLNTVLDDGYSFNCHKCFIEFWTVSILSSVINMA